MDGVSVVVAVLAALVIVLALVFYVVTLVWTGRNRLAATAPAPDAGGGRRSAQSDSLARGFSYLHVSPRSSGRRPGVQQRVERAFWRIDAVDPYAAPRRIGEALLHTGLTDPAPPTRPEDMR